jgi:Holliday junction resolvasome RuvABC endonuclease subunit
VKITVVGVDPSLRNFGLVRASLELDDMTFQVLGMRLVKSDDEAKQKKTVRKNSDDLRRARILQEGMAAACLEASFAFVEVPVGSQSARAMASYGICVGVLSSCPIPVIEVTPSEVKLAMTGHKTATKDEMIEAAVKNHPDALWLTRKLKGESVLLAENEHLADAIGAIMAGIKSEQFKAATAMFKQLKVA